MIRFVLFGHNSLLNGQSIEIKIPKAKIFETVAVGNGEEKLYSNKLIGTNRRGVTKGQDTSVCTLNSMALSCV